MESNALAYQNITAKRNDTKKHLFTRLLQAKAVIDNDLNRNWSVSELSRIATVSEFHFIRKFQEAFGLSPYRYQLNKKLDTALEALLHTDSTVVKIADNLGFSDLQSFSKAFKKKFGTCPTKLRVQSPGIYSLKPDGTAFPLSA